MLLSIGVRCSVPVFDPIERLTIPRYLDLSLSSALRSRCPRLLDCGQSNTATLDATVTWAFPECSEGFDDEYYMWNDVSCVQPCGVPSDFDWQNDYFQTYICDNNNYEWCATGCDPAMNISGRCNGNWDDDDDDDGGGDCGCYNDDDDYRRRLGGRTGNKNAAQHAPWSSRFQHSSSAAKPASQKRPEPKRKPLDSVSMRRRLGKDQARQRARDAMAEMAKKAPIPNLKKASHP